MADAAWVAAAFAAGTIPSPWLLARALGRHDVIAEMRRKESPGDAHFVVGTRLSKAAVVVAIVLDMAKGFVPALLAARADLSGVSVALVGVAAVAGHSFAPFLRHAGGRGLTTAAGVALAVIPRAMVATGLIAVAGTVARRGGQGTSIGFGLMPLFAWALGYEPALVWMSGGIVALIALRRLEGIGRDVRGGAPLGASIMSRLFRDLPGGRTA